MAELKKFKKGEIIFNEGDWEMCMYDIRWGNVGIYADYGKDTQKLLTELAAEDYFGEMGLVESLPRSATAVALNDVTLNVITSEGLGDYFSEKPQKVLSIMQHMSNRIRELSADYKEACDTIAEYVELEGANAAKPDSLIKRMMKFVGISKKAKK